MEYKNNTYWKLSITLLMTLSMLAIVTSIIFAQNKLIQNQLTSNTENFSSLSGVAIQTQYQNSPTQTGHQEPSIFPTGNSTHTVYLPMSLKPFPQGQDILFVSDRAEAGKYDVYSMDSQGNNVTRLTELGIDSYPSFRHRFLPQWSPDGTRIAIQIDQAIYLMYADGSQIEPLYEYPNDAAPGLPVWSPDSTKIAFVARNCIEPRPACSSFSGGGVRVIDINTKAVTQVIPDTILMDAFNDVEWSPDGASVFAVPHDGFGGDDTGIIVGHMDGSPAEWILSGYFPEEFDISPNGQKIIFVRGSFVGIYSADIDGNNVETIYSDFPNTIPYNATWHPDGHMIAYVISRNNGLDRTVITANTNGSNAQDVLPSNHSTALRLWGWSADGQTIFFNSDKGSAYQQSDIFMMHTNGSNLTNLTPNSAADDAFSDYHP